MVNLWTGTFDGNTHKSVATVSGLTFTEGTTYCIQISEPAYVREGTTGEGIYVFDRKPFAWTAGSDDLYIKANNATVNIAG